MRTSTGCGPGKTARTEETSNKKTAGRPGAARCKAAQKEIEIMEQKAPQTEHLIYGKNPVTELLKSGAGVDTVLLSDGLAPQVAAYYTAMAKEAGAVVKRVKPAKLKDTGYELQVPAFINVGDKIEIDTRTGEYSNRVK